MKRPIFRYVENYREVVSNPVYINQSNHSSWLPHFLFLLHHSWWVSLPPHRIRVWSYPTTYTRDVALCIPALMFPDTHLSTLATNMASDSLTSTSAISKLKISPDRDQAYRHDISTIPYGELGVHFLCTPARSPTTGDSYPVHQGNSWMVRSPSI